VCGLRPPGGGGVGGGGPPGKKGVVGGGGGGAPLPPPPPPPPAAQKDEIELSLPLSLYHTARRDPERVKQYQPQYEIISIRYNIHAPK